MILFDSSVIIDARDPDSPFHDWAKSQIASAVQEGGEGGAVNTVVISEASVRAVNRDAVPALLQKLRTGAASAASFGGGSRSQGFCDIFGPFKA